MGHEGATNLAASQSFSFSEGCRARRESCKRTISFKSSEIQKVRLRSRPGCSLRLSHNTPSQKTLMPSNHKRIGKVRCSTVVSHKRRCGLWRRNAVYQYRVRVPADLKSVVGATHINRSLRTPSFTVASRLVRTMAYGMKKSFEALMGCRPIAVGTPAFAKTGSQSGVQAKACCFQSTTVYPASHTLPNAISLTRHRSGPQKA